MDANDDYRYSFFLEGLIRKRNGKTTEDAERFLEYIRRKIPRFTDEASVEEATLDEWREKIAGFIVALEGEAGRNRGTDSDRPSDRPQRP
jgi:hypothetical protein